jgi:hypothetical protein
VELIDARALQLGLRQKAVDKKVGIIASNPLDFGQALVSKVVEFFPHLLQLLRLHRQHKLKRLLPARQQLFRMSLQLFHGFKRLPLIELFALKKLLLLINQFLLFFQIQRRIVIP